MVQGIFLYLVSITASISFSSLPPERLCRPFALLNCDLNRLDGNISSFSDRFLTNFQDSARLFEETQGPGIVFKVFLWDRVTFSGIPGQCAFSGFPRQCA